MNISKKRITAIILLVSLLGISLGYAINPIVIHHNPSISFNVYFTETYQGEAMISSASGNLITVIGEDASLKAHIGTGLNLTSISMGNCTVSSALTQITTEANENGFARSPYVTQSAEWSNGGHYAVNFSYTFVGVTAMETVNSAGLQWSVTGMSDSNLFAVAYLTDGTAQQFPVTSTCAVTWVLTFTEHP